MSEVEPVGFSQLGGETITLGGRFYRLSSLTVADLGELEDWARARLPDPIAVAREIVQGMPDAVAEKILMAAYEDVRNGARRLGSPEVVRLLGTFEGYAEMLYLHGRRHHPAMTRDEWGRVLADAVDGDLEAIEERMAERRGGAIPDPKAPSSAADAANSSTSSPNATVGTPAGSDA